MASTREDRGRIDPKVLGLFTCPSQKPLTRCERAFILGMRAAGASYNKIVRATQAPKSTVRNVVKSGSVTAKPRSGRPRKYTDEDVRAILAVLQKTNKVRYNDIRAETGLELSDQTLWRIIRSENLLHQIVPEDS